jgi:hypothetical protein
VESAEHKAKLEAMKSELKNMFIILREEERIHKKIAKARNKEEKSNRDRIIKKYQNDTQWHLGGRELSEAYGNDPRRLADARMKKFRKDGNVTSYSFVKKTKYHGGTTKHEYYHYRIKSSIHPNTKYCYVDLVDSSIGWIVYGPRWAKKSP